MQVDSPLLQFRASAPIHAGPTTSSLGCYSQWGRQLRLTSFYTSAYFGRLFRVDGSFSSTSWLCGYFTKLMDLVSISALLINIVSCRVMESRSVDKRVEE